MILKIFGLSFIIVTFLHIYALGVNIQEIKPKLSQNKNQKVNIIKLSNYQIKEIPKPIKKEVEKPKVVKKIEKKPIKKDEIIKKKIIKREEIIQPQAKIDKIIENKKKPIIEEVIIVEKVISKEIDENFDLIKNRYIFELKKRIEEYKRYPRVARKLGEEGILEIKFTILENGVIKDLMILKPSKYKRLNEAILNTMKEIYKFNPIPKELKLSKFEFTLPIEFKLN